MFSHLEVSLPEKPLTPKNISESLKGPQRKLWKEPLFVQYDKNKSVSLISYLIPIKSLPDGTKVLCSTIAPIIKEGFCFDARKCFARHCANVSSHIQVIDFDQSYSLVAHTYSFRANIYIKDIHRLTDRILDVSNAFQNANFPIHERVCFIPPPYYMDWFKNLTPMLLSIEIMLHFSSMYEWNTEKKTHPNSNGIDSFMQWLKFLNTRKVELIMPSTSRSYIMELCPILRFLLIMLSTLLITRYHLLN